MKNWDKFDKALLKKRVDPGVIMQAKNCSDYVALRKYEGPKTKNQPICDPLELHKLVKLFGCPNFLGARVPVVSNLNIDSWKFCLRDYWDTKQTIVDLSWPKGQSVNDGVQKDTYLGSHFILNYPSVDDIVTRLIELGP